MRVGLFGGTFDPPHIGHLIAAQDALETLALERVVLIPAALPPHKQERPVTVAAHRLAMLRLAVGGDTRLVVDPLELERTGPSYTVDTVRVLAATGDELVLLMGADQYREFETWREPDEIRRLAAIAVLRRAGEAAPERETETQSSPAAVYDVPVTRVDVSSTQVRAAVAAGRSVRYLVPDAVAEYIDDHALYRSAPAVAAGADPALARHPSSDDRQ